MPYQNDAHLWDNVTPDLFKYVTETCELKTFERHVCAVVYSGGPDITVTLPDPSIVPGAIFVLAAAVHEGSGSDAEDYSPSDDPGDVTFQARNSAGVVAALNEWGTSPHESPGSLDDDEDRVVAVYISTGIDYRRIDNE